MFWLDWHPRRFAESTDVQAWSSALGGWRAGWWSFNVISAGPPPWLQPVWCCLHTVLIIAAFHHITRSDSPPLSISMSELLLEQAVFHLGSLIWWSEIGWFSGSHVPSYNGSFPAPHLERYRCFHFHRLQSQTRFNWCASPCLFQIDFFAQSFSRTSIDP